MLADFHLFGPLHLTILFAIPLVSGALVWITRQFPGATPGLRVVLASLLIVDGLTWHFYRYFVQGVRFPDLLPLELCDAAFWLTAAALLTLEEHAFDLAYYWGIAGSGMALLTPYLRAPLHTYQSLQYFTGHTLLVVGVLTLIGTRQARPRVHSWWFAWWVLNLYGAAVAAVDFRTGTNFMYLRQKPGSISLLDAMGHWPWYIAGADVFALAVFWLMQQPFRTSRADPRTMRP
jgi:hypothetical integral membrane protein (TIGR02206 family)